MPNKGREFIWGHQQRANARAPRHKQLRQRAGKKESLRQERLDFSKIDRWLGERERGFIQLESSKDHSRARAERNEKKRKRRIGCTRRWMAWYKKNRRQWNEYRQEWRKRRKAQTKQTTVIADESVYTKHTI